MVEISELEGEVNVVDNKTCSALVFLYCLSSLVLKDTPTVKCMESDKS